MENQPTFFHAKKIISYLDEADACKKIENVLQNKNLFFYKILLSETKIFETIIQKGRYDVLKMLIEKYNIYTVFDNIDKFILLSAACPNPNIYYYLLDKNIDASEVDLELLSAALSKYKEHELYKNILKEHPQLNKLWETNEGKQLFIKESIKYTTNPKNYYDLFNDFIDKQNISYILDHIDAAIKNNNLQIAIFLFNRFNETNPENHEKKAEIISKISKIKPDPVVFEDKIVISSLRKIITDKNLFSFLKEVDIKNIVLFLMQNKNCTEVLIDFINNIDESIFTSVKQYIFNKAIKNNNIEVINHLMAKFPKEEFTLSESAFHLKGKRINIKTLLTLYKLGFFKEESIKENIFNILFFNKNISNTLRKKICVLFGYKIDNAFYVRFKNKIKTSNLEVKIPIFKLLLDEGQKINYESKKEILKDLITSVSVELSFGNMERKTFGELNNILLQKIIFDNEYRKIIKDIFISNGGGVGSLKSNLYTTFSNINLFNQTEANIFWEKLKEICDITSFSQDELFEVLPHFFVSKCSYFHLNYILKNNPSIFNEDLYWRCVGSAFINNYPAVCKKIIEENLLTEYQLERVLLKTNIWGPTREVLEKIYEKYKKDRAIVEILCVLALDRGMVDFAEKAMSEVSFPFENLFQHLVIKNCSMSTKMNILDLYKSTPNQGFTYFLSKCFDEKTLIKYFLYSPKKNLILLNDLLNSNFVNKETKDKIQSIIITYNKNRKKILEREL